MAQSTVASHAGHDAGHVLEPVAGIVIHIDNICSDKERVNAKSLSSSMAPPRQITRQHRLRRKENWTRLD